jgi:hypothetical protein
MKIVSPGNITIKKYGTIMETDGLKENKKYFVQFLTYPKTAII